MSEFDEIIELIRKTITKSAKEAENNAALAGSWGDNGASKMLSDFSMWIDGYNFATTGATKKYEYIIDKHRKENDPEYQEYLKLKAKFNE